MKNQTLFLRIILFCASVFFFQSNTIVAQPSCDHSIDSFSVIAPNGFGTNQIFYLYVQGSINGATPYRPVLFVPGSNSAIQYEPAFWTLQTNITGHNGVTPDGDEEFFIDNAATLFATYVPYRILDSAKLDTMCLWAYAQDTAVATSIPSPFLTQDPNTANNSAQICGPFGNGNNGGCTPVTMFTTNTFMDSFCNTSSSPAGGLERIAFLPKQCFVDSARVFLRIRQGYGDTITSSPHFTFIGARTLQNGHRYSEYEALFGNIAYGVAEQADFTLLMPQPNVERRVNIQYEVQLLQGHLLREFQTTDDTIFICHPAVPSAVVQVQKPVLQATVYPVPASNHITVDVTNATGQTHLKLINCGTGHTIVCAPFFGSTYTLQLAQYQIPAGVYCLLLQNGNQVTTKKVVIAH